VCFKNSGWHPTFLNDFNYSEIKIKLSFVFLLKVILSFHYLVKKKLIIVTDFCYYIKLNYFYFEVNLQYYSFFHILLNLNVFLILSLYSDSKL
jgi:hypothetical protein